MNLVIIINSFFSFYFSLNHYFSIIDLFLKCSLKQSYNLYVPKYHQLRTYSLSNTVLTRSSNNSASTRNIGQSSKGNYL